MQLKLDKSSIFVNENILDSFVEQPLECDILLPDYCPNVMKILKCDVTPVVHSTQVSSDRVVVDGSANVHVYYTSEENEIRCFEQKVPFSKTVELRSNAADPQVSVRVQVDYMNCRAINPRRIDARGALTIGVKGYAHREEPVLSNVQGENLYTKKKMEKLTQLLESCEKNMVITEELELAQGMDPVRNIIRACAYADITDYKVISNKIVLKGEVNIHTLYQPENGENELEKMEHNIPISQIVDLDGVDEESVCSVCLEVTGCTVTPRQDAEGESRILSAQVVLNCIIRAHRPMPLTFVTDAYCTAYEYRCNYQKLPVLNLMEMVSDTHMCVNQLEFSGVEEISRVADLWCRVLRQSVRMEENKAVVTVLLAVCVIAYDNENKPMYCEKTVECEYEKRLEGQGEFSFNPVVQVRSCSYSLMEGNRMELKCELIICGCVYSGGQVEMLEDIVVDESRPIERKDDTALTLYFAEEGESVWEIAKRYNTSVDSVIEENAMEDEVLQQKTMLMIPIV